MLFKITTSICNAGNFVITRFQNNFDFLSDNINFSFVEQRKKKS